MIASDPVLLGAGALFGAMQIIEDRKRKVAHGARAPASRSASSSTTCSSRSPTSCRDRSARPIVNPRRADDPSRRAPADLMSAAQRAQADAKQTHEQQAGRKAALDQQLAALTKIAQVVEGGAR